MKKDPKPFPNNAQKSAVFVICVNSCLTAQVFAFKLINSCLLINLEHSMLVLQQVVDSTLALSIVASYVLMGELKQRLATRVG